MSEGQQRDDKPASPQKSSIQETDQAGDERFVMANTTSNWNPDIVLPDGDARNHCTFAEALILISESLSPYHLKVFISVISTIDVPLHSVEYLTDFKKVFNRLEEVQPTKAVSITIKLLSQLGIDTSVLKPHEKDKRFEIQDNYDTDIILTLGVILDRMSKENYDNFLELVCRRFFDHVNRDNLSDRGVLLKRLLQEDYIKKKFLNDYFVWIRKAGCSRQLHLLFDFCARQGIEKDIKPHIYQPTESSSPLPPTSLPPHVQSDGPGIRSNEKLGVEEQTPQEFNQQLNNAKGNVNDGAIRPFRGDITTVKDDTDTLQYGSELHPQKDEQGNSAIVLTPKEVSKPPPFAAPVGIRGQDHDTQRETRSLSDSSKYCYGSMTPGVTPPKLPALQINVFPLGSATPTTDSAITSPKDLATPSNENLATPPKEDPATRPTDPGKPPIYQSTSLTSFPIPVPTPRDDNSNKKWKFLRQHCKLIGAVITCITIFSIIGIALFSSWIGYSVDYNLLFSSPDNTTEYTCFTGTSLIECYDPTYTEQVRVTGAWTDDIDPHKVKLYSIEESELQKHTELYPLHFGPSRVWNGTTRNYALNYFFRDCPMYVTKDGGTVFYSITSLCHTTSSCQFRLYLFDSLKDYKEFTRDKTKTVPNHFTQRTDVVTAMSFPTNTTLNFEMQEERFYFVVAVLDSGVELNVTTYGNINIYNISSSAEPYCSVTGSGEQCTLNIDHEEPVCILAKSDDTNCPSYPLTVTPRNVKMNTVSRALTTSGALCIFFAIVLLVCFVIYCCYRKHCRRSYTLL